MSEYLDGVHDVLNSVERVAQKLHYLSKAFFITGNNSMTETLGMYAEHLEEASKTLRNVVGKELTRSVRQAEQGAFNTAAACLAMSEMAKKEGSDEA